jgi:large conductance mechanosensitive channel
MLKGFRDFILRGNVVDLAVAVLIGAAFGQITTALTSDIITPFISAIIGSADFSNLKFHIHVFHHGASAATALAACVAAPNAPCLHAPGDVYYGVFLNSVINFLLVSAVIYFAIVLPVRKLLERINGPAAVTTKACPYCISDIPLAATRCKFCTQELPAPTPATPTTATPTT